MNHLAHDTKIKVTLGAAAGLILGICSLVWASSNWKSDLESRVHVAEKRIDNLAERQIEYNNNLIQINQAVGRIEGRLDSEK